MACVDWCRCGGNTLFMEGSEISGNPVGETVFRREEFSNFYMEMSGIMQRIIWSEGKENCMSHVASIHRNKFVVVS
jgi:hypothetical protein